MCHKKLYSVNHTRQLNVELDVVSQYNIYIVITLLNEFHNSIFKLQFIMTDLKQLTSPD